MAACTSSNYDEQDIAKRSSLLRCPNNQYTVPFWLKVKQLFIGKELKKNSKISDEQKKVRVISENIDKPVPNNSNISRGKICGIIVLVALFCFSSVGCIIMWFTDIYLKQILETMTIHNGSFMLDSWRKPSLKPLICVYVFNYTNLERFVSFHENKIRVQEIGPYCYRETLEKINIHFDEEEGTVTYGNKRTHEFDPIHSRGSPDDLLVLPNPSMIMAVSTSQRFLTAGKVVVNLGLWLTKSRIVLRIRAHDFFFGYDDNLIKAATGFNKFLKMDFNDFLSFEKIGILSIRAAETKDTLTVKTGEGDLEHIDVVTAVNGKRELTIWFSDECNRIDGSDGAFFPRKDIDRSKTLYLFHQDICRRLPLIYDKDVDFQDGIIAMRFHMPSWVYDTNGTCFCDTNCPPKGIFDLTRCSQDIPFLMSFPHFLHGDPSLTENIDGLNPNISLHDFYIDIQPNLGFTLGMVSRLQVNMQIKKTAGIPFLGAFKDKTILPIVWIEVFADHLPPDLFRVIYHATFTVRNAQLFLMWGTLISTIVTALCILHSLWKIPGRPKNKLLPLKEQSLTKDTSSQASSQLQIIQIVQPNNKDFTVTYTKSETNKSNL